MKIGWAFFGLAVVAAIAYALNRGMYVGSEIHLESTVYKEMPYVYVKNCKYLFPSGVYLKFINSNPDREKADVGFCPLFQL